MISQLDKDNYLKELQNDYNEMILQDITACLNLSQAGISALMLMLCYIDCLKTYRYGLIVLDYATLQKLYHLYPNNEHLFKIMKKRKNKKSVNYYVKYINEYLKPINKGYKGNDIYYSLRCGLIHSYTARILPNKRKYGKTNNKRKYIPQRKYIIYYTKGQPLDKDNSHLTFDEDKNIGFSINQFYSDFRIMCDKFFAQASKSNIIKLNIFNTKSFLGRISFTE